MSTPEAADPASPASGGDARTEEFERHRRTLFGIAYRMLGSVAEAEDVVQDTWLRWHATTAQVANPGGYLARTAANLSVNRLRSASARRERYVGPWLPEPLVTAPDASGPVEVAEDVSLAMMVVLETLSPLERAVFLLREVFGFSYDEIADAVGSSPSAVRQTGHRAREHVQARRPRYRAPHEVRRAVTDRFLAACVGGDLNEMLALLSPEVTAWTDGGGKVRAALRPLYGPEKVARWLVGVLTTLGEAGTLESRDVLVNGEPGLVVYVGGRVDSVALLEVSTPGDGPSGAATHTALVTGIRLIRNPDKLHAVR